MQRNLRQWIAVFRQAKLSLDNIRTEKKNNPPPFRPFAYHKSASEEKKFAN